MMMINKLTPVLVSAALALFGSSAFARGDHYVYIKNITDHTMKYQVTHIQYGKQDTHTKHKPSDHASKCSSSGTLASGKECMFDFYESNARKATLDVSLSFSIQSGSDWIHVANIDYTHGYQSSGYAHPTGAYFNKVAPELTALTADSYHPVEIRAECWGYKERDCVDNEITDNNNDKTLITFSNYLSSVFSDSSR